MNTEKVYLNGKIIDADKATVAIEQAVPSMKAKEEANRAKRDHDFSREGGMCH